jgi:hypothetical protein
MQFSLTQVGHFCWHFFWGLDVQCASLSGVGNSSRLPTNIPSSKTRLRHNNPPLTVREAPREQSRPTDTRLRQDGPPSVAERGPIGRTSSERVRGLAAPEVNLLGNMVKGTM